MRVQDIAMVDSFEKVKHFAFKLTSKTLSERALFF